MPISDCELFTSADPPLNGSEAVKWTISGTYFDLEATTRWKVVMVEPWHFLPLREQLQNAGGVPVFRLVELHDLCRRLFLSQFGRLRGAVAFARPRAAARGAVWSGSAAAKI